MPKGFQPGNKSASKYEESGLSYKMPEYNVWNSTKDKCNNPNNKSYSQIGGKGIKMCERWTDLERGFLNFYEDVGSKPAPEYVFSRVDENKDFTPDNCCWFKRNEIKVKKYFINEEYLSLSEISNQYNIHVVTLRNKSRELNNDVELQKYIENLVEKRNKLKIRKDKGVIKLTINLRKRISEVLLSKFDTKKNKFTRDILGCTLDELVHHLESQFTEGMTWENRGLFGWHIDHIIPLSSAMTIEEIYKLNHYTNLQPLWAEDNLQKRDKIL